MRGLTQNMLYSCFTLSISRSRGLCDKPDKMCLSGRWAAALVVVAVLWESVIQSSYDCPAHPGCFAVSTISQIKLSQETLTQTQTAGSKTAVSLTVSALCGCILTHAYWLLNTI